MHVTRILIFILFVGNFAHAQQTVLYTQYTFNKAGVNPAASGAELNQKYYYLCGFTRQWYEVAGTPKQHFVNFSYTLRPPRSYRFWQNFGVYLENDDSGLMSYSAAYLSYTYHTLIRKKVVLSFGLYAGVRSVERSTGGFDLNDPAVKNSRGSLILWPDVIPGVRISDARFFAGISVRQISINSLKDFQGRRIGNNSQLWPTVYMDYGRKKAITDRLHMMPSVALNIPIVGIPSIDLTAMWYYANRIGGGFGIRNTNFASAILQIRFLESLTAGFSYSYPLNKMRYTSIQTFEFMIGIVPYGMASKMTGPHSVAKCPSLSY